MSLFLLETVLFPSCEGLTPPFKAFRLFIFSFGFFDSIQFRQTCFRQTRRCVFRMLRFRFFFFCLPSSFFSFAGLFGFLAWVPKTSSHLADSRFYVPTPSFLTGLYCVHPVPSSLFFPAPTFLLFCSSRFLVNYHCVPGRRVFLVTFSPFNLSRGRA